MNIQIFEKRNHAFTTSLDVAEKFGKKHKNVVRDIRNLECSEQFSRLNFAPSNYTDERGKKQPMYEISRDGFMFLAMGFTGKEAASWKEKYINAFNVMEKVITQRQGDEWKIARSNGKLIRHNQTDVIKQFVEYAKAQGSKSADKYYINISTMENKALFMLESALPKPNNLRDVLDSFQLTQLTIADSIAMKALQDGMKLELNYKDIYQLAKRRVEQFAELSGKSHIPQASLVGHNQPPLLLEGARI